MTQCGRRLVALIGLLGMLVACSGSDSDSFPAPTPFPTSAADTDNSTTTDTGADTTNNAAEPDRPTPTPFDRSESFTPTEVRLTTEDGEILSANTFGEGAVVVILAHMRGRDQSTWAGFAQDLARAGHTAMTFDFRGYGASSGTADENLDLDLEAAIDYVRVQGASSIIVMGASMGGTAAINAAAEWNLGGVVSLSAPGDFLGLPATAVAVDVGEPALIVVTEDDQPFADDARDIDAAALVSQLVVLPGNSHGTNMFNEHGDQLTSLLLDFVDSIT